MPDTNIYIRLKNGTENQVELSNDGTTWGDALDFYTQVEKNENVIWQLASNSGIDELTKIEAKDGTFNIFPPNQPKTKPNGTVEGKVKDDATGKDAYNILFTVNGQVYTVDPELGVDPPPIQPTSGN